MKKLLAIILAAALLAGLVPAAMTGATAQTPIAVANARIDLPEAGGHPDFTAVSADEEKYSVSVESWYLYENNYPSLDAGSEFLFGKRYALRVRFEANGGYEFAPDAVYTINSQKTSCYGSKGQREIIYELSGDEIDVTTGAGLKNALSRNMPVKKINIVSNITVSEDCTITYDTEHLQNYHDTVITINKGAVVTVRAGGFLGSFWPSYEGDWENGPLPDGKLINNGGIIVKNGGGVIADFDTNNGEVIVERGGECVCACANYGSVYVENGAVYQTSQGREVRNNGTINVAPDAILEARFGSTIINEEGGTINLDGTFLCGCVGFESDSMWFENHGTVNGGGSIILKEADRSVAPVSDMDALIVELMGQLGQEKRFENWDDINIFRMREVGSFEDLAAEFPGNRSVAGEEVAGDMDVMVSVETDITVPAEQSIETMGKIFLSGGATLTVADGALLECAIENNANIVVEDGGQLRTTMGGSIENRGNITVNNGGSIKSHMGGEIINREGAVLTLDGEFFCGCVGFESDSMWFENYGTVNGNGSVVLNEADRSVAPVSDMDALIEKMMEQLGQEKRFENWEDIGIYKLEEAETAEELEAYFTAQRTVAGEEVVGNMDTVVMLANDITVSGGKELSSMCEVVVPVDVTLNISENSLLECAVLNRGTVNVCSGGMLATTMNGYVFNIGKLYVDKTSYLKSHMGGIINNVKGADFTLEGEFYCGCIGLDGNDVCWFDNNGGFHGDGRVILYEPDHYGMPVGDMAVLAAAAREMIAGAGDPTPAVLVAGDINGDLAVDNKDLIALFRYLSGCTSDEAVNADACDINADGSVNNKDFTRLFKGLSGWDVTIY